jgi:hypothetical protein
MPTDGIAPKKQTDLSDPLRMSRELQTSSGVSARDLVKRIQRRLSAEDYLHFILMLKQGRDAQVVTDITTVIAEIARLLVKDNTGNELLQELCSFLM